MTRRPPDPERTLRAMHEVVDDFELDLTGLTVLTEAASGPFVVTPLIAALAGAERVLALTAPSRYATVDEVTELTHAYARRCDVASRIDVTVERDHKRLSDVAVVTNLGFVRPLDRALLERLGPCAAVALMCEPWEVRAGDVDLDACRALGIPALGTAEDDDRLRMFDYLPEIAGLLLLELGVHVSGSRLVLLSTGRFATALEVGLTGMGAEVASFAPTVDSSGKSTGGAPGSTDSLPDAERGRESWRARPGTATGFESAVGAADALVVADYPGSGPILGPRAAYSATDLRSLNAALVIAHIAGDVELDAHERASVPHAPARIAPAGTMSVTAGALGARPVARLHGAGLRVGAELARARARGLDTGAAESEVLASLPLALGRPSGEEATA